jgi:CDP-diacylglycerol---glycerol-3-phosphate 3-phosphatidyltransferase
VPSRETGPGAPNPDAPPPGIVNVANILTLVRTLLVPVFVFCLIQGGTVWRLAALAAFGGASFTDFLDGQLARKRGLVTDFGKIADPIADKALTGAALITLSALGELPGWVTGLILARELGITALRFAVIRRGVIAASQGGKLKTFLQIIAICLYVLPASLGLPAVIKEIVMAAALVVTLVTGADYVVRAVRMIRTPSGKADDTVVSRGDDPPYPAGGAPDGKDRHRIGRASSPSPGDDPPYPPPKLRGD